MRALEGHTQSVRSLAFLPDGGAIVSGGKDGTVRVWDLYTGETRYLDRGAKAVAAVAVSPDGSAVAFGGEAESVSVVAVRGGGDRAEFPCHGPVCAVAFCNFGRHLIAGTGDRVNAALAGAVIVFERQRGPKPVRVRGEPNGVWSVVADPLGKAFAWGGGSRRVQIGNLAAQDVKRVPEPSQKEVRALARSPDGRLLAVADDARIRILDAATGREIRQLSGPTGRVEALAFTPDGGTLVSAGWDRLVRFWDVADWSQRHRFDPLAGIVRALALSPDGLVLAASGDQGQISLWDCDGF